MTMAVYGGGFGEELRGGGLVDFCPQWQIKIALDIESLGG
jgi:hypothetical protein